MIALRGLAGTHGRFPNPAVSIISAAGVIMRRSKPTSFGIYDVCLHRGKEVINQASAICNVGNNAFTPPPSFTCSRECVLYVS